MSNFPVDPRFHSHPKAGAASLAALGLWTLAGSWANDHHTDGDVPEHMVRSLSRGAAELADELVSVGLWSRTKRGYRFHQWLADSDGSQRNLSRAEHEALRSRKAIGGTLGNHRRWHADRGIIEAGCAFCQEKQGSDYRSDPPSEVRSVQRSDTESGPNPVITTTTTTKNKHSSPAPPTEDDPDWLRFWEVYPKRLAKGAARKAWAAATRKAAPDAIIEAASRYAAERGNQDPKFTAHPATWLNQERWEDQAQSASAQQTAIIWPWEQ